MKFVVGGPQTSIIEIKAFHRKPLQPRRGRSLVAYFCYAAFDSSPPAIMLFAEPNKMIVMHRSVRRFPVGVRFSESFLLR